MAVKYSQEPKYNGQAKSPGFFWQVRNSSPSAHSIQKFPTFEDIHCRLCESHQSYIIFTQYTFKLSKQHLPACVLTLKAGDLEQ